MEIFNTSRILLKPSPTTLRQPYANPSCNSNAVKKKNSPPQSKNMPGSRVSMHTHSHKRFWDCNYFLRLQSNVFLSEPKLGERHVFKAVQMFSRRVTSSVAAKYTKFELPSHQNLRKGPVGKKPPMKPDETQILSKHC